MNDSTLSTVTADAPRSRFRVPHWGWFLLATVILAVIGISVSVWLPYHRERQIIQEIERWGGSAYTATDGPAWLRRLVGDDRLKNCKVFDRVHGVILSSPVVLNAEWAQVKKASSFRDLYLHLRTSPDAGLVDANGITILEWSQLKMSRQGMTTVTDEGLNQLSRLRNLKYLWLDGTAVTDLGLAHLSGLPKLEFLYLSDTAVTYEGIKKLRKAMPDCEITP